MFGWKPKAKKKTVMVEHCFLYQLASGRRIQVRATLNSDTDEVFVEFPNKSQARFVQQKDKEGLNAELQRVFAQLKPPSPRKKRSLATRLGFGPSQGRSDS